MKTVTIVQPYIATYRRRFYELLRDELGSNDIQLRLLVGTPYGGQRARKDAISLDFAQVVPQRVIRLGRYHAVLRRLPKSAWDSDLLIVEQAVRNLESFFALARKKPTALWGHGSTITARVRPYQGLTQRWMTRRADWFFAYTEASAERAASLGARSDRTTVVYNTLDTAELLSLRAEREAAPQQAKNPDRFVAAYIGGLDEAKRIDVLLRTAKSVFEQDPRFLLVVAGDGTLRPTVEKLASEPWLDYVGVANAGDKVELATTAKVLLNPGRVGLIAIDSFALGLPIVTLRDGFHGPELDYLNDDNSVIVDGSEDQLVRVMLSLMKDIPELDRLRAGASASVHQYPLQRMVSNFAAGVQAALGVVHPPAPQGR